jgi:hypothetical protein
VKRGLPAALAMLAILAGASAARPARAAGGDTTQVTFVAGGSVYVNAGAARGIAAGDTLELERDGRQVGRLVVTATSPQRSVCVVVGEGGPPRIGDRVRVPLGHRPAPPVEAAAPPAPATGGVPGVEASTRVTARPARWLRGRAAIRFLTTSGLGSELVRPMLDLYVNGMRERGPLDVVLDLRAHRTRLTGDGVAEDEMLGRVYRASIGTHARGAGPFVVAGRQFGPGVVSQFDGLSVGWNTTRWAASVYGGSEPEPLRMGYSRDVVHAGGYVEARHAASSRAAWSARVGVATSYDRGNSNRNFAFAQTFWRSDRVTLHAQQEVDVSPAWRRESGAPPWDPTNTFAAVSVAALPWLDLRGGYDARHSVRLWRDRETPETEFDDQAREGGWVGATAGPRALRVSGEVRTMAGGGQNDLSWSGEVSWIPRVAWAPAARSRYATYLTSFSHSQLTALTVSVDPPWALHLEASGGRRIFDDGISGEDVIDWYEGVVEWSPGAPWFVHGAWTVEHSDPERMTETLGGLSMRF